VSQTLNYAEMKTLQSRPPIFTRVTRTEDENEFNFSRLHASEFDQQAAAVFPYVCVILSFCQKDVRRSPHSPTNPRKPVPVQRPFVFAFKAWKFHFVASSYAELSAMIAGYLQVEFAERKASWAEIGVCKFFNPHECIMMKDRVKNDSTPIADQLDAISARYMENIGKAHQLLSFPPTF
jgi:hypothetical protein